MIVAIVAVLIFISFCAAVGYFVGVPMVQLAEDPAQFQALVDSYGFGSRLIFIGMVVLQVVVAFIPGEPIELAAGYAFGFVEGTLLTLAGFFPLRSKYAANGPSTCSWTSRRRFRAPPAFPDRLPNTAGSSSGSCNCIPAAAARLRSCSKYFRAMYSMERSSKLRKHTI